jgi:hypothetical protein
VKLVDGELVEDEIHALKLPPRPAAAARAPQMASAPATPPRLPLWIVPQDREQEGEKGGCAQLAGLVAHGFLRSNSRECECCG